MNVGILGIGNLGSSIINGLTQSDAGKIKLFVYDKNGNAISKVKEADRVNMVKSEEELYQNSDILFVAVKPLQVKSVLHKLSAGFAGKTVISAAAGVSLDFIKNNLTAPNIKIYRIMTNLGCEFNSAPILVAGDEPLDSTVQEVLGRLGKIYQVNEPLLNALTTIVGSGPALISYFLDSLVQYCKIIGLEGDSSREIVNMVALSTSDYLKYNRVTYEELIEKITTPGGVTLRVLHNMDKMSVKGRIVDSLIKGSHN
ncbi:MAG: NAD(P)-binding domain-containing protein [Nitrososphaerota archaeon]|nr:NAD(P)-binding domain-containing protein [Nitrososphaerota archaeon]MDG6927240.1 NAD(P)-binding domain-containing protein [Nitrososphaerota archaeon]MDG6930402.1 NAD(P)-binding domain-containing protein [Nitrososphaerota archaeon]MDG6932609.1 NAD(P)-binding domain-containing protein [Nitrososphaerota archaeon]MDG6935653.1 NAD(P)-binding domain-containing protein [Nitrososphaerota archaeon]